MLQMPSSYRGGLIRLVKERAGDVSCAVAEEEHGIGDDFLGVASRVRDRQGQDQHECSIVRAGQEIADVATCTVRVGDETETEGAGDVGQQKEQHEATAVVVREAVVEVDA